MTRRRIPDNAIHVGYHASGEGRASPSLLRPRGLKAGIDDERDDDERDDDERGERARI
jgi:hypothetical protein